MASTTHANFDRATTGKEVAQAFPEAIKGRTILITGVNKLGTGYAIADAFASQAPYALILAGRSRERLQECAVSLETQYPSQKIKLLVVDLSSLQSVKSAGKEVLLWVDIPSIDLVINNAGIMRHGEDFKGPMPVSRDGIEEQFAINHLGHWLLTNLIMPKILAAASVSPKGATRIVNVSSSGNWVSPFRPGDLGWKTPTNELPEKERPALELMRHSGVPVKDTTAYVPTAAYGQSKTCNVLFSVGLNQRLFNRYGVLSLALNPGEVQSELGRNTDPEWLAQTIKRREELGLLFWKTTAQGASTSLVAATDPKLTPPESDGTAIFLDDCQIGKAAPHATDGEAAEKLWHISEDLTGEKFSY